MAPPTAAAEGFRAAPRAAGAACAELVGGEAEPPGAAAVAGGAGVVGVVICAGTVDARAEAEGLGVGGAPGPVAPPIAAADSTGCDAGREATCQRAMPAASTAIAPTATVPTRRARRDAGSGNGSAGEPSPPVAARGGADSARAFAASASRL